MDYTTAVRETWRHLFAGMNSVLWTRPTALVVPIVYAVCAVAGLAVGAIHGAVLVQLVRVEVVDAGHG